MTYFLDSLMEDLHDATAFNTRGERNILMKYQKSYI